MRRYILPVIWAILYILCGAAGCIPGPEGALYSLTVALSILFFVPPSVMLYRAAQKNDTNCIRRLRNLALAWLITAVVLIVCNIASVAASEMTGKVLHYMLTFLAAPMVCGQNWLISLFLWSCILMVSLRQLRKKQ